MVLSTPVAVGSWVADAQGVVTGAFTVPSVLSSGVHTFVLTGRTSGVVKTVTFTVTQAVTIGTGSGSTGSAAGSGILPRTGADVAWLVGGGAAVVLVGGVLIVAAGRRKRANPAT